MPTVKPISELQRNMGAIAKECAETKRPIYLTKNGSAALVIIDAETYDKEMEIHDAVYERETRVYNAIMRGYDDYLNGRVRTLEEATAEAIEYRKKMGLDV